MKRTAILILTMAVLIVLAAPVGAAKGGKPGKPSGVDVLVEADLWWANVTGDRITYSIGVDNQTGAALIGDITFIDNFGISTALVDSGPIATGMTWLEHIYLVRDEDLAGADPDPIIGTVSVAFGSPQTIESASDTVEAVPVPPCPFTGTDSELSMFWTGGPCYYPFPRSGSRTISATLAPGKHHPHDLVFTMRDHYLGNWCMVPAPDGTDDRFRMFVFFPDDGICLQDGMQGEEMPVGNPVNFVLVAPRGTLAAKYTSS